LREEVHRNRRRALLEQLPENEHEWKRGQKRGEPGDADHHDVHAAPTPQRAASPLDRALLSGSAQRRGQTNRGRAHACASRDTCQTSQRAIAFTISVTAQSTAPTAINADACRGPV